MEYEDLKKSKELALSVLRQQLEGAGVDVSEWGKGGAKTLTHLQKEIESRETILVTDERGNLLRKVIIGGADIFYVSPDGKKYRLKEDRQVFKDGRERKRNLGQAVSEKIKLDEDIKDAMIRGIREELGIEGEISLTETGVDELLLSSPSYPGLQSKYIYHKFEVILNNQQFKLDGYVENQEDKSTYFVWEEVDEEFAPQAVDSNNIEAILETQVKEFLEFRKNSASSINSEVCEVFATIGITDEQIELYFHTNPEITRVIRFVLESFSKPRDFNKVRRKDGSHIAVHSLQLFLNARDYFKIKDTDVFKTLLVHDILEDTQVSEQEIKDRLGEREAQLAFQMTEEHLPEELTQGLEKADKDRLSIVKFCEKLKSGGDAIVLTEIIDRVDDISDLTYLTQKLEKKPEEKEKVRQALISKFGKCVYTIDMVAGDSESEKVKELKAFFQTLIEQRLLEMKNKFNLEITQSEISDEVEKYKRLQKYKKG